METVTVADISKLRSMTGSGIMNSKKALIEAKGDFEKAIDILRKKGEKIAANRLNKESTEGVVIAKVNEDASKGIIISLNCETDFVAKNENFIKLAHSLAKLALQHNNKESFLNAEFEGMKVIDKLTEQIGIIGEKIEIKAFKKLFAPVVGLYIHVGNKIASIVGLSEKVQNAVQIGKEIAMQVVGMNPIALDELSMDETIIEKELDVTRSLLRQQSKPENIIENITKGKLNKFLRENTLVNQQFINNDKLSVKEYLESLSKELKVISFERVSLSS